MTAAPSSIYQSDLPLEAKLERARTELSICRLETAS